MGVNGTFVALPHAPRNDRPLPAGLLALDLQFGSRAIALRDRPTILRAGEDRVGQGHDGTPYVKGENST